MLHFLNVLASEGHEQTFHHFQAPGPFIKHETWLWAFFFRVVVVVMLPTCFGWGGGIVGRGLLIHVTSCKQCAGDDDLCGTLEQCP